jgi:hypothetical protein
MTEPATRLGERAPDSKWAFGNKQTLTATRPLSAIRLQRLAVRLHALGPRATYELLSELARGANLEDRLPVYAALDPGIVRALGADQMPLRQLRVVGRDT